MIIKTLEQRDINALAELYYQFWNEKSDIQNKKKIM